MSRKFFEPLLSFWEPIISQNYFTKFIPKKRQGNNEAYSREEQLRNDPHETFDSYFNELTQNPNNLRKEEKEFFEKHYPQRVGKKFNPYETLGIDEKADLEAVKEAYRKNAMKYHPKNDNSQEAQRKFRDLSRAYNDVYRKQTDDYGEDVSKKSLFHDFHTQVQNFGKEENDQVNMSSNETNSSEERKNERGQKETLNKNQKEGQQNRNNLRQQEENQQNNKYASNVNQKQNQHSTSQQDSQNKKNQNQEGQTRGNEHSNRNNHRQSNEQRQSQMNKGDRNQLSGAQLYSQSSYFEFIDGKRKLHITKMYGKDGKIVKVDRIQDHKADGSVEVTETFDDGKEVRNNRYVTGQRSQKQGQIGRN